MKDFDAPRHNTDMNIDERLKRADPASSQGPVDGDLILRAAQTAASNGARRTQTGATWHAKARHRTGLAFGAFVTAVSLAVAVFVAVPGVVGQGQPEPRTEFLDATGGPEFAGPEDPVVGSSAIPTAAYGAVASLALTDSANLPSLRKPIRYYPYGQFVSQAYNTWWHALGIPQLFAAVALISKNVTFAPSPGLLKHKNAVGVVYRVLPNATATAAADTLARLFGLSEPIRTSKAGAYGLKTVTVGSLPSNALSMAGVGQDYTSAPYRGLALIGSKNGIRWVYGNSKATAWRDCRPGDSISKNVSIISRGRTVNSSGGAKYKNTCRALPSGLGPNRSLAVDRAKLLFHSLGYKTGSTEAKTPNGGLFIVANGFDESRDGRATYFQGTVSGFLKVAGQVTTLAQKVVFSSSSQQIVSAEGFIGNAVAVNSALLKTPAAASRQISVYDQDPTNSIQLFNPKNVAYDYPRTDLSSSILNAPAGDASKPGAHPKRIVVTKFKIFPGVVSAYDGSTWLIPSYAFSDSGGYLGSVKALPSSKLKVYNPQITQN